MGIERRSVLKSMGIGAMMFAMRASSAEAETPETVFELRVYHAAEGKLPALLARFRDHTMALFTRHGITNIAYWTPTDDPLRERTLIYILRHRSREEATKNWKAFSDDPEWIKVKAESEANGTLVDKVDSTFMTMTDFSPKL